MQKPDFELYGWVTLIAFVGHVTSFLWLQPSSGTNEAANTFPWRRLMVSLPLCFVLGIGAAALASAMEWSPITRDGLAAVAGYGGTAVISAAVQALIERFKPGEKK